MIEEDVMISSDDWVLDKIQSQKQMCINKSGIYW